MAQRWKIESIDTFFIIRILYDFRSDSVNISVFLNQEHDKQVYRGEKLKVALYMRVSTEDQENENQDLRLQEVAQVRGWDIVETFQDKESGGKRSRPGLDAMISGARKGQFNAVLAVKVDRIARSLQDLLEIAGTLGSYGVDLFFTDQDLDISSSQGKLMFQILGAFAEYERDIIKDRTRAGLRRVRRQGKKLGRPRVHGAKVRKAQELRADGLSIREIAGETGISKSAVDRILRNVPKTSVLGTPSSSVADTSRSKGDLLGTEGEGSDE
jgi:DNA invertase Pin-like site-specific DNA recombinase